MLHAARSLSDGERAILQQDGDEGHDTGPKVLKSKTCVASKAHLCDTCGAGTIPVGARYHLLVTLGDDGFQIQRFCSGPQPATQPGNWRCESERLEFEEHQRATYVAYLTEDGTMSPVEDEASYERHLEERAAQKAARDAAEVKRAAERAVNPRINDDDLPF